MGMKMKWNKKMMKYAAAGIAVCIAVPAYAAYTGRPGEYHAETAWIGPIAGSVEVTGKLEGEQETQFYAEVTAPVKKLSVKKGQTVSGGYRLLEYDTKEIEDACLEAELSAQAVQSQYDAQVKESGKQENKYAQAAMDEQAYKEAYRLARSWQTEIVQGQYGEAYALQEQVQGIEKKMNEVSAQISETESKISNLTNDLTDLELDIAQQEREIAALSSELSNAAPGTDEYIGILEDLEEKEDGLDDLKDKKKEKKKKLDSKSDDISDLQSEIANLKAKLPDMTGSQMTPEENLANINYNQYLEDVLRNLTETQADIASSENQILNEDAKNQLLTAAQISKLRHQLTVDDLETAKQGITAGFDGIVTMVYVKENAYVSKGEPLFAIQGSNAVKVSVLLSKYDVPKVKEGQRAKIMAAGNEYEGEVTYINRIAETDSSDNTKVRADVHIENPDASIILGMETDVTIYTQESENATVVSREAIYTDDEGDYCYVIRNGRIAKQYVTVGIVNDEAAEILEGIDQEEIVITDAVTDDKLGEKANALIS